MLACWFGVDRSTVTRATGEVRPLLAERGCTLRPAGSGSAAKNPRDEPPTATTPPGTPPGSTPLRSRRPPNGSSVNDFGSRRSTSPTAARPSRSSVPKRPPSSGYAPATHPGHGHCIASPPNGPG
ncbi:hypothetical protein ACIGXQ_37660 [Streptomyces anulatus]